MIQPKRVLDMCCKAGGAAMGLHYAWPDAHIVGIDVEPQPNYPFTFRLRDALSVTDDELHSFDFIWASPPCQAYVSQGRKNFHPELIEPIRKLISCRPYVMENVVKAPLINPILLSI